MIFILNNIYRFRVHLLLASVLWLGSNHSISAETLKIVEQPAAVRALADWFECLECEDGELQRVLAHGDALRPLLLEARRNGPTPAMREQYRRYLGTTYQQLRKYANAHDLETQMPGEQAYIAMYMHGFESRYKGRAAVALDKLAASEATETPASPGRLRLGP